MMPGKPCLHLLIVDDHEQDRRQLLQILRAGFPEAILHQIADEMSFVEGVMQASFDVVVAEYRLGWADALTVLRTIKAHQPQAAVIWVSRAHLDEALVQGMRAGLSDYVSKRRLHRLVDVINASLDSSRTQPLAQPQALQALLTSEQRYRAIAKLMSDYAYVLRVEAPDRMAAEWINEGFTAITGYTLASLEARGGWMHLLHPQDVPTALQRRQRWLRGQTDISEFRLLTRSGEERWVREYTAPDSSVPATGAMQIYGAGLDTTQRRLLEGPLRLAQTLEALGQLAGGIAHDFNNVLQVVSGYSDMLLRRMKRRTPLRQYAQEIRNVAEQGAILTRQLMTLSRRPYPQPRAVDLDKILEKIAPMMRRILGNDIDFRLLVATTLGQVQTDPEQLEQVIMTMAVNARDAMPQGGGLTIELARIELPSPAIAPPVGTAPGSYLRLIVSDTGPVPDEGTSSSLFEPLALRSRGGKGADLGLFTVYGIVNQLGGTMYVETAPGVSTTYTIYWPCVHLEDTPVDTPVTATPMATANGETILLVEDEVIVRDLVCKVLQASGYAVLEAADGEQALGLIDEHRGPVHLLVVDVVLPGISGLEVANRLAALYPGLPVLYISGYAPDAVERDDLSQAATAFLQKPFTPVALLERVHHLLQAS